MKQLIEDVSVGSLDFLLDSARSQAMDKFDVTLSSVDLNNVSNNADKIFEIVSKSNKMANLGFALFKSFLTATAAIGPIKAMQAVQTTMFLAGFNYASYLHEQRELATINTRPKYQYCDNQSVGSWNKIALCSTCATEVM